MNIDNKGFTLIELIITIALLAVISIISFVSITGVINQSKINDCESLLLNIKSAAKEYVSDQRYSLSSKDDLNITAERLVTAKYLSSPIKNPFSNEEITPSSIKIEIKLKEDYSADTVTIKNGSNEKIICENGKW